MKQRYKFYLFFSIPFLLLLVVLIGIFQAPLAISPLLDQKIDAFLKESQFQGTALVAQEGKILFSRGYGLANEEYQIPNTIQTVFRIGSITKQFTAVAILQLQEKGLLNVNDPIKKYLPDYPPGDAITIHHLLSHTSGIPSITDFSNLQDIQRHPSTPEQTMAHFKHLPLKFTPGTDCEYSDSGYIVLGRIIEIVTKTPYENYLQENIFRPLAMNSTYYEHHHLVIPHRASGYVKKDNTITHAAYIDMSFPHASGALASTVEDLYKWDRALKENSLLTKESTYSLFTVQASSPEHKITYGYGFRIGPQNRGMENCSNSIAGHFGTIEGFEAASIRYTDKDLTIILLSNVEKTNVRLFHKNLAHLIHSYWRTPAM